MPKTKDVDRLANSWEHATARFARCRLLIVGDMVADHYIYGQPERISREAPVLIVRHEHSEVKLGGAANVAANVRALGGEVLALGIVGDDEMGRALDAQFQRAGIDAQMLRETGVVTETKTRVLAGGTNTTRQQMLRIDRGENNAAKQQAQRRLAALIATHADKCDAVIVSDYGAGTIGAEVRQQLAPLVSQGIPVFVDSRHALANFSGVSLCKPNEPELAELVGRSLNSTDDTLEAGKEALSLLACQSLLVTRGRHGMILFRENEQPAVISASGLPEAVDVTGAGDTVLASLSLALAAQLDPLSAAIVANVAGGVVVQKLGTATVSQAELAQALREFL